MVIGIEVRSEKPGLGVAIVLGLSRAFLMLFLLVPPALPQAGHEITECDPCGEILLQHYTTLGAPDDPIALDFLFSVTGTREGLFLTSGHFRNELVAVYDSAGRYVKSVGSEGPGPGEFRAPRVSAGPLDRVWIFDPANFRTTELLPDLTLGRSFPFSGGGIRHAIPLDSSHVLVSGGIPDAPGGLRRPVHVLTADGEVVRSFGEFANTPYRSTPAIALDPRGGVWTLAPNEYRLVRWSMSGSILEVLHRDAPWFEDWTQGSGADQPYLLALDADSEGRLWVFGRTVEKDQFPQLGHWQQWNEVHDVVVEVIDPAARRVVARRRFPQAVLLPVPQGGSLVYSPRQNDAGYVFLDLFIASVDMQ